MSGINDWLRGNKRGSDEEELEFYEDTHDANGNYIGRKAAGHDFGQMGFKNETVQTDSKKYGNIVVYRPATPEEVETLIDFLRRGEPAVANLNELEDYNAQRILDYLSGAIFALGGSIHRITGNIFLLSPQGVEIQSYTK